MPAILAVLAAALAVQEPTPEQPAVAAVEVTASARVAGDLKTGVVGYPSSFFTVTRPSSAFDMVAWLPGFALDDTRDLRGLEGSTGNVLIDGKPPTSKTDTLASVLRRIPAEQVERVDLIVGGAPGINMRGRNVMANVILKVSPRARWVMTGQTYVDSKGRVAPLASLTLADKRDGRALDAAVELARNVAIFPGYGYGPYVRRDRTGATLFEADDLYTAGGPSLTGNVTYERPLGGGRFRINALGRYYGLNLDEVGVLDPGPGELSFHGRSDYLQGEFGLRWERTFGPRTLELQGLERLTSLETDEATRRPPVPTTFATDSQQQESVLRAVLRHRRDDRLTFEGFAEAGLNTAKTHSVGTRDGLPQALPSADVEISEVRGETGASLAWKPDAKFSLDLALRLEASRLTAKGDQTTEREFVYAKPRAALSWAPDSHTQLRLRAEHEVGQVAFANFLTFNEFNSGQVRGGNTRLLPARAFVGEATVQRSFWSGGDLSLTLRRKALRDVVDIALVDTPDGVFGVISNIGDGRQSDAVVSLNLPLKRLGLGGAMLKGSISALCTRVDDPTTGRSRPLSGQPQRMAELHFTQDFPQWRANWGVDALLRGGSSLFRPFGNEAVDAWARFNVYAERRLTPKLALRVEVQNLPGPRIRQTVEVFDGPRNTSPLNYVDEKRLTNGPMLFLRLRQTLE